jgi:hypothetical protein
VCVLWTVSSILQASLQIGHFPNLGDEEAGTQRGQMAGLRSHSWEMLSWNSEPGLSVTKAYASQTAGLELGASLEWSWPHAQLKAVSRTM